MLSTLTQHIQTALDALNEIGEAGQGIDLDTAMHELNQAMEILDHGHQDSWGELLNLFVTTVVMTVEELEVEIEIDKML